jgi:hypothetical protein
VTRILSPDEANDKERLLGVTPMDDALAAYLDASVRVAPLRAVHGTNGTFDHDRKALLARLRIGIRRNALLPSQRVIAGRLTDAAIDDLAHAHPEYLAFLDRSKAEKTQMVEVDSAMLALTMLTNRHNILLRIDIADRTNMPRNSSLPE